MSESICVIIPVHNEARFIGTLVARIRGFTPRVVVVDDGSSDGSPDCASRSGAVVLRHAVCRGKGAALKTGFAYAVSRGYPAVVAMDGDGQHDPGELDKLAAEAERAGADMVLGIRYRDPLRMPRIRRIVNASSSALLSLLTGQRLHDIHSGFRWIRTSRLREVRIRSDKFDAELELLFKMCRAGRVIREVPVRTLYGDEISKIHPWKDTMRFFRVLSYCLMGL